ncbi:hypothetical protein CB1_000616002 [Camelus ferus]|nr:hypothetical protein CB1_000616002 [Camelus ferus]
MHPPPGGPGTLSLHFANPEEAQRWAALVRGAAVEGQNGIHNIHPKVKLLVKTIRQKREALSSILEPPELPGKL